MKSSRKKIKTFFTAVLAMLYGTAVFADQTTVAHWEFTTGYDSEKSGSTVVYTPNDRAWESIANTAWKTAQPYFLPNSSAITPEECKVTVHTSDGKWQVTSSGSNPNYLLRLNTASITNFTATNDYTDGSKHDQYFEVSLPTLNLTNVKINFSIGDGSSSSTKFGVVYSVDGGTTWTVLDDYASGSHWNTYVDKTYSLNADNSSSLIVRMLIQSATKTSNYNLKYFNILADDFTAPQMKGITPANGTEKVSTTGKITMMFDESVVASNGAAGILKNNSTSTIQSITPTINNNKVTFPYENLELLTSYTFTIPANSFADLSGNKCTEAYTTTFTTAERHPIPLPVLDSKNRLWYNRPAAYWEEALPLGNGRLGAMVSGSVCKDTLQLNEDTFWGQSPNSNYNANAKTVLAEVREKIFNGEYAEAQKLAIPNWNSTASHGAQYQAAGCVLIGFPGQRYNDTEIGAEDDALDAEAYVRDLDLASAVATTSYQIDDVTYTRKVFTSFEDNVTIMHIEASEANKLNLNVCYAAPSKTNMEKLDINKITDDGMIEASLIPAKAQTEGVDNKLNCYTFIKVINEGGTQSATTSDVVGQGIVAANPAAPTIEVSDATAVTIVISSATNFVNYNDVSGDAEAKALAYMTAYLYKNKDYATSEADHTEKYKEQFDRVSIDLGENDTRYKKDTEQRIKDFYTYADDPGLIANYFQFGRYLLICSSQPGTQPANLQGLWNPNSRQYPAWDSKYTTNINVEMNYWPAEVTNLSECHMPFINMVKDVSVTGAKTAQQMYGARGWVLHHNTDIWRVTGAVDNNAVSVWPTCNAWFCSHLWEKYLFSGDKAYLAEIYPVMKGCAQFYEDFLVQDPNSGYMVVCPSNSPENHPGKWSYVDDAGKTQNCAVFAGVAMDNQMVYDVLKNTAEAARILGQDATDADKWDNLKAQLPPYRIGQYGQVQEWYEDWDKETSSHRHLSHLWGAYPGNQVSPYTNATVYQAVKKSLIGRGDAARGWSMGWKVCEWARMLDGDHALAIIKNQMRLVDPNITINDSNGGTYANMFDSHAPFQIDGNFGCCAGIAEMLVQSHAGFVHLLPALPAKWSEGNVKGLRARGGFEIVNLEWQLGEVTRVSIHSTQGGNLRLRSNAPLMMSDGTALAPAEGVNTNALNQEYYMPEATVANISKIPETNLPTTYLYDVSTTEGETITLVSGKAAGIEGKYCTAKAVSTPFEVNLIGQRVSSSYKGITLKNYKKIVK
jgi:hypothetical protein